MTIVVCGGGCGVFFFFLRNPPVWGLFPKEVKKGVVRSETLREKAVEKIRQEAGRIGFEVKGETDSPITGPKGNHEILLYLN